MSLTSFVSLPEIKERLNKEYDLPAMKCDCQLRVQPRTKKYSLVGTAFDYLIRFWIKKNNPQAEVKSWVAETAVEITLPMLDVPASMTKTAKRILREAKQTYTRYLETGDVTDEVIRATVHLAQLDPIYRALYVDPNLGTVEQPIIDELKELLSLADPKYFLAKKYCALNPTFGDASSLVGGADADLIIDDVLIDIKTTQSGKLDIGQFHQLIGYYILNHIGKINGKHNIIINRLGVYYSRYGELLTFPSAALMNARFPQLVEWFKKKAEEAFAE
jgi:hypothetical protein